MKLSYLGLVTEVKSFGKGNRGFEHPEYLYIPDYPVYRNPKGLWKLDVDFHALE